MEGFWYNCRFSIFRQISQVGTCNNFQFLNYHGACELSTYKAPNQARIYQDLIKTVSVIQEWLWMVFDRIIDFRFFRFFVKFPRSRPAIIFSFLTIMEHFSYPPTKLLIKQRFIKISSRWWVLLWKHYDCFLTELSILDFSSNFTGQDLQ